MTRREEQKSSIVRTLDWYNIGFSFFAGLIWIWAYKKSGHLISSIIAHGGANLAGIIFLIITNGVV